MILDGLQYTHIYVNIHIWTVIFVVLFYWYKIKATQRWPMYYVYCVKNHYYVHTCKSPRRIYIDLIKILHER